MILFQPQSFRYAVMFDLGAPRIGKYKKMIFSVKDRTAATHHSHCLWLNIDDKDKKSGQILSVRVLPAATSVWYWMNIYLSELVCNSLDLQMSKIQDGTYQSSEQRHTTRLQAWVRKEEKQGCGIGLAYRRTLC